MILKENVALLLVCLLLAQPSGAQVLPLPPRGGDAPSRDQLIRILTPLSRQSREDTLFRQIMDGNVPRFIRSLVPVAASATAGGSVSRVRYYVTPDYFAVGSDTSYLLIPMTPMLAQRLADTLRCTLPTRKMVNDIYAAAALKLAPVPIPPTAEMITVPVFASHDSLVWAQRAPLLASFPAGTLVGGTKKDVVISNKIRYDLKPGVPKPVVIYGWHQLNGVPIQPLYNGHGETYADYSHGIRLVQQEAELNGSPITVSAILKNDTLAALLSDEGPIRIPRYGEEPTGADQEPAAPPQGSLILQNFPNPFNPSTSIEYVVGGGKREGRGETRVSLIVYDLLGREVAVLVNERKPAGTYGVTVDASGLASGVYIYRLTAGSFVQSRRMMLVR